MDKFEYWWMSVHNEFLPADISRESYSYEEIYHMSKGKMRRLLFLSESQAEYIVSNKSIDIDKRYAEYITSGVKSVTIHDSDYPVRLRNIDDKPYALFYLGRLPYENEKNVAIIGSRSCSEYGRVMAKRLASGLAKGGVGVISGMAIGIDGIAQMHTLDAGASSYAVLGGSVSICYPRSNKILYERLINSGGVISEYAIDVPAKAAHFPKRNRIISGLSDGVIVVQAKIRSGTFITVDYALSQGKDVMVVPGMVTDPLSVGCNCLIMQGAYPVQCAEDVINILNEHESIKLPQAEPKRFNLSLPEELDNEKKTVPLTVEEGLIYDALDLNIKSTEQLADELGAELYDVIKPLVTLELKGLIKECGKNLYVRCM